MSTVPPPGQHEKSVATRLGIKCSRRMDLVTSWKVATPQEVAGLLFNETLSYYDEVIACTRRAIECLLWDTRDYVVYGPVWSDAPDLVKLAG